jgi:hypothetical protein
MFGFCNACNDFRGEQSRWGVVVNRDGAACEKCGRAIDIGRWKEDE